MVFVRKHSYVHLIVELLTIIWHRTYSISKNDSFVEMKIGMCLRSNGCIVLFNPPISSKILASSTLSKERFIQMIVFIKMFTYVLSASAVLKSICAHSSNCLLIFERFVESYCVFDSLARQFYFWNTIPMHHNGKIRVFEFYHWDVKGRMFFLQLIMVLFIIFVENAKNDEDLNGFEWSLFWANFARSW